MILGRNKFAMKSSVFCASILSLALSMSVDASFVYESSRGNYDWVHGASSYVNSDQFIGARFTVDQPVTILGIGGHFQKYSGYSGSVFGAIVSLDNKSYPSISTAGFNNLVASSVFTPDWGKDFLAPIDATLTPGTYAVILGSGLFGATGNQGLTLIQPDRVRYSNGDKISWGTSRNWYDGEVRIRHRILLSDSAPVSAVPVPATAWLLISGLIGLAGVARQQRN
ncbi:MAG: VPLPA-CTERM sorting domain-containing protein [Gammaproteobacteria bacterium]